MNIKFTLAFVKSQTKTKKACPSSDRPSILIKNFLRKVKKYNYSAQIYKYLD